MTRQKVVSGIIGVKGRHGNGHFDGETAFSSPRRNHSGRWGLRIQETCRCSGGGEIPHPAQEPNRLLPFPRLRPAGWRNRGQGRDDQCSEDEREGT